MTTTYFCSDNGQRDEISHRETAKASLSIVAQGFIVSCMPRRVAAEARQQQMKTLIAWHHHPIPNREGGALLSASQAGCQPSQKPSRAVPDQASA